MNPSSRGDVGTLWFLAARFHGGKGPSPFWRPPPPTARAGGSLTNAFESQSRTGVPGMQNICLNRNILLFFDWLLKSKIRLKMYRCAYSICRSQMHDNHDTKVEKGETEVFSCEVLILYVSLILPKGKL